MNVTFDRSMRSFDADGRLHVARTNISKAAVNPYRGREISNWQELGLDADRIYQLYRHPGELAKAAPSYHNIPLLIKHVAVSAEAPRKDLIVGTLSDVRFEDPYLTASIAVWDKAAIDLIESEAQSELSCGYYFTADMTPGVADGVPFQGVMRSLVANHVALVAEGRAGSDVSVADSYEEFMKAHPKLVTAIAPYLAADADKTKLALALDAALDSELGERDPEIRRRQDIEAAEDEENSYYGCTKDEWEAMSAADRKKARDKWAEDETMKELKANDRRRAKDSDPDHRKDFDGGKDSAETIRAEMRAQAQAAAVAREAVRSIVGVVTMDSAEDVYFFALKHMGIKPDATIPPAGYKMLFEVARSRRSSERPMAQDGWRGDFSVADIWKEVAA